MVYIHCTSASTKARSRPPGRLNRGPNVLQIGIIEYESLWLRKACLKFNSRSKVVQEDEDAEVRCKGLEGLLNDIRNDY